MVTTAEYNTRRKGRGYAYPGTLWPQSVDLGYVFLRLFCLRNYHSLYWNGCIITIDFRHGNALVVGNTTMLIMIIIIYLIAQAGQKIGAQQMFDLHHFYEETLGEKVYIK